MKVKYLTFILFLLLTGLGMTAGTAVAQGLAPTELVDATHSEPNLSDDKILLDHEPKPKSTGRDSLQLQPKSAPVLPSGIKPKPSDHKPNIGEEEDDALSFNFLYYIIQKFKISDLVDE